MRGCSLVITFGFVVRAKSSSSSRAGPFSPVWSSRPSGGDEPYLVSQRAGYERAHRIQDIWTTLWCLARVSDRSSLPWVIFGLRRQVREAWQLGQYTLLEKIGEGNMGSVYRASHAMLRRPTAVKLLPPDKAGADQLRRFEREVQLTSLLTHPSTVVVFDYGRTADGVFYYAMEYLEGLDLRAAGAATGAARRTRRASCVGSQAARRAHGVGLIHRDIKPANVILVPERGGERDVAKVVDFGLVKDLDRDAELSRDDMVAGTPHYMSPEVITAPDSVDARSDLYSLGCVGYYLLTGHRVFEGRTVVEVRSHHLHSQPVRRWQYGRQPVPESLAAPYSRAWRRIRHGAHSRRGTS
jgi:serine/threonine-protein kinase